MKTLQTIFFLLLAFTSIQIHAQFTYPNEECSGAIPLPVNPSTEFIDFIDQDEDLANPANSPLSACGAAGFVRNDMWYTFTATQTNHFIRVIGANLNTELFSDTCGGLTSITCSKNFTGLTIGQTYYLRVYKNPSFSVDNIASHLYLLSPPTNDDCNNATLLKVSPPNIPLKFLTKFNTNLATSSNLACTGFTNAGKDLWLKFVATSNQHSVYWFFYSDSHDLKIYSGTPGNFTVIGTSVVFIAGEGVKVLKNLVVGQTYFIRISNTTSTDSNFDIAIADVISNDECIMADTVQMNNSFTCENSFMVNSLGASSSTIPCTPAVVNDSWYTFKASSPDLLITTSSSDNYITKLNLLSGNCNTLTCVVSNASNVLSYSGLTVGNYYYLSINSSAPKVPVSVCISPAITNNDCSGASEINVQPFGSSIIVKGTNASSTQSLPKCGGLTGVAKDVWYKFTAIDTACFIDVKMDNSSANFEVTSGSCANPISILCVQNNGSKRLSNLSIGTTYFIRIYSQITLDGVFTISLSGLPINDACINAKTIVVSNNLDFDIPTNNGMLEASVSLPACSTTVFNKDVWYQFTPNQSSAAIISHAEFNGGTAFYQVYSGSCAALTSISCFSHSITEKHKAITLTNLVPNQTYYIRQYGDKYTTTLSVVNPPDNDLISGAIKLIPVPANVKKIPSYSLHGASKSFGRICTNLTGVPQHDVWFYFIAENTTHNVSISSFNSIWDEENTGITYRMEAFKGYAADSAKLAAKKLPCTATPFALTGFTVGDTIYLRVYNTSLIGSTTIFSIDVSSNQNLDEPIGALELIANNDYQYQLTTTGATQTLSPANCKTAEFSDDDIWLKFTHTLASKRVIAGFETKDIVLELFSGTPSNLTSLFCSNNIMLLPTNLTIGTQYFVRAYSKANAQASTFKIGLFDEGNALSNNCFNPSLLGPNLVKNPKCESDYVLMPGISVQGSFIPSAPLAKDWWISNNTTPDIWDADYPFTYRGNIPSTEGFSRATIPHGGKGMFGMFYQGSADWSEYVTGELSQPLTPGKYYMISFYAKIDNTSSNIGRSFKQVGALLTNDRQLSGGKNNLNYVPNISLPANKPLIETNTWRHVCGIVKADLPYQYITLGNFGNRNLFGDFSKDHYMFVDDVFVGEIPDSLGTGINNHQNNSYKKIKLELFPNPANSKVMVKWNNEDNKDASSLSIYDIQGREVWSSEVLLPSISEFEININDIPVGVYVVMLKSDKVNAKSKLIIVR